MTDDQLELYRALRETQEKYVYFLLAAAGAAIAFAVTQTQEASLTWWKVPLAAAVLCWGLSFFFGCRYLVWARATMYANYQALKVERGEHPRISPHPDLLAGFREDVEKMDNQSIRPASRQFPFLITGAVLYIAWHVLEMYLRTVAVTGAP
jgi:hypothetical protein